MRQTRLETTMADVYQDQGEQPTLDAFITLDRDGSLIIGDLPDGADGTWSVIIENQYGVPHLHVWMEQDMGNDPAFSVNLKTGDFLHL